MIWRYGKDDFEDSNLEILKELMMSRGHTGPEGVSVGEHMTNVGGVEKKFCFSWAE